MTSRGFENSPRPVPTVEPDIFFDEPQPVEISREEREEIVRWVFSSLGEGSLKSRFIKFAAWSKCLGYDTRPLREIADELDTSLGNFHGKVMEAQATLNNRPEVKPPKK